MDLNERVKSFGDWFLEHINQTTEDEGEKSPEVKALRYVFEIFEEEMRDDT